MDGVLVLERVPEMLIVHHLIAIPSADAFAAEEPAFLKLVDDALHCTNGDADGIGDIALAQLRVSADRYENVAVVGEKRPRG